MGPAARVAFWLVRGYQRLASGRPTPCRYVPTCSMYALDAYEFHGFWRGSSLTARRIARCHPWARSGWDPVPPARSRGAAHGLPGRCAPPDLRPAGTDPGSRPPVARRKGSSR